MYWYYKYPLLCLLILILVGLAHLVWTNLPSSTEKSTATQTETSSKPADNETSDQKEKTAADSSADDSAPEAGKKRDSSGKEPTEPLDPETSERLNDLLTKAQTQLSKENFLAARKLSRNIIQPLENRGRLLSPLWKKAARILSRTNTKIFNSSIPVEEKEKYVIQAGDTLAGIAAKFNTTISAIQRSNGLDPTNPKIYPNDVLQIYQGDWRIKVFKENFRLLLYDDDLLFKVYKIGIGRQDRTPTGTFRIQNKLKEPDWTRRGKTIPYGDPDNVLGTRWMGLKPVGDTPKNLTGYGIHGTWKPETIGQAVSNGCVRLKNENVNELFSIVTRGTPVRIKEKPDGDSS